MEDEEEAEEGEAVVGEIFELEILPIDCFLFHICLLFYFVHRRGKQWQVRLFCCFRFLNIASTRLGF